MTRSLVADAEKAVLRTIAAESTIFILLYIVTSPERARASRDMIVPPASRPQRRSRDTKGRLARAKPKSPDRDPAACPRAAAVPDDAAPPSLESPWARSRGGRRFGID